MKRIALLMALIASISLMAEPPAPSLCDNALNACIELSKAQDESIKGLKDYSQDLEDQLASQESKLPAWFWAVSGFMLGSITITVLHK